MFTCTVVLMGNNMVKLIVDQLQDGLVPSGLYRVIPTMLTYAYPTNMLDVDAYLYFFDAGQPRVYAGDTDWVSVMQ